MIQITLPFPAGQLMPNRAKSLDWHTRAEYAKTYRMCGRVEMLNALQENHWLMDGSEFSLHLTFNEPNKRIRDLDGMLSAMKAGIDGMADALGINDRQFVVIHLRRGDIVKGGSVGVKILKIGEQP